MYFKQFEPFIDRNVDFVRSEKFALFTAIEVIKDIGLDHPVWRTEIHVNTDVTSFFSEFEADIIFPNLSRLTKKYLNYLKEFCEQKLKEEYSDYLNNHAEYEFWVESLEKINVEIQLRD